MEQATILIVDDEPRVLDALEAVLAAEFRVLRAGSGPAALALLRANEVATVLTDYKMPGMTGVEMLRECQTIAPDAVPEIIRTVHRTLEQLTQGASAPPPEERPKPAVPVSRSVQHDFIVCLEDGKKLKMLKRYLRSRYNMSPDEYRRRWGLPPDYPMVAPAYAARRSDFAKKIGLGRGVRRRK